VVGVNPKQKRFAHEYSVDHNGAQAAIRAGYAEARARHTASRLLANVAVKQIVAKLDGEKLAALGIEGTAALEHVDELLAEARVLQPKIWKGRPVTWTDEAGEVRVVTEFRAAALAGRLAELKVRLAGLLEAKSSVAVFGEVVYKLSLDRDLSDDAEGVGAPRPSEPRPVA
jgi:hypothetical protein